MMNVNRISIDQAREMLRARVDVQLVDIRDSHSYGVAHIPGSTHLSEQNLEQFIKETDSDTALIVMCYHGISAKVPQLICPAAGLLRLTAWTADLKRGSAQVAIIVLGGRIRPGET